MGFVHVPHVISLVISIFLFLLHVSSSYPLIGYSKKGTSGAEGIRFTLILDIFQFAKMSPGVIYDKNIPNVALADGHLKFGIQKGFSEEDFNLVLRIHRKHEVSSDTLSYQTLTSVNVTMIPLEDPSNGHNVSFSNVQISKTNKVTQMLKLLSGGEIADYNKGNYMNMTIDAFFGKPQEKGSGKTLVWNIVVLHFVVLVVVGIAVLFAVRRKEIHDLYFWK